MLVPALDEPVAIDVDWGRVHVVSRRSESVVLFSEWDAYDASEAPRLGLRGCMRSGPGATADGCTELPALVDPVDISTTTGEAFVVVRDGIVASQTAFNYGTGTPHCANATGDGGCAQVPSLRGARYVAAVMRSGSHDSVSTSMCPSRARPTCSTSAGSSTRASAQRPACRLPRRGRSRCSRRWRMSTRSTTEARTSTWAGTNCSPSAAPTATGVGSSARRDRALPGRPLEGVAASPEFGASAALYATVPSAGAILAFRRNRPPVCGFQDGGPQLIRKQSATPVALPCRDLDGDPLSYSVERLPGLGRIAGFSGGAALYKGPDFNHSLRWDSFSVRVSDGSDSEVVQLGVGLGYVATGPIKVRVVDKRLRMDKKGRIRLRVRCISEIRTCNTRLAAYRGRRIAHGKAKLRSGQVRRMRLRLPKSVRRSVRRHRKGVRLRFVATAADAGGGTGRASRRVLVRGKPAA